MCGVQSTFEQNFHSDDTEIIFQRFKIAENFDGVTDWMRFSFIHIGGERHKIAIVSFLSRLHYVMQVSSVGPTTE